MAETRMVSDSAELEITSFRFKWISALLFLLFYGCATVGPDYTPPEMDLPGSWHAQLDDGLKSRPLNPDVLVHWWQQLDDPLLTGFIVRAVASNTDLQTAQARVREARARRGVSRAGYFPVLDASGNYVESRASESTSPLFGGEKVELYNVGLDAGWEIDIFGGVRRAVEAADADLEASREDYYAVLVSLLAETALTYVDVRTAQARIEVAEANIKAQQETYELTRSRFQAGLTDELAVQGARYALSGTLAQIPVLKIRLATAMNSLAVLLGQMPGTLDRELAARTAIPVPPEELAVGVPAEALRSRPDVRRAERQLAAQTARIGVAKAELYPKFSLFGTIGYEALAEDNLFDSGNLFYSYGPQISWGIFRGGAVWQNIEVQNARQEQALQQYYTTVLGALKEAEDALIAYAGELERRDHLVIATRAATQAFHLARNQYQAGLVDFSVVLIAQQSMLSYEDQLAQSEGTVITNLIRLYKSLGGGWRLQEPAVKTQ